MGSNIDYTVYLKQNELSVRSEYVFFLDDIRNPYIRKEMEAFIKDRCERLASSTILKEIYGVNHTLIRFLNMISADKKSLTEWSWTELERIYAAYLGKRGYQIWVKRKREPGRKDGKKRSDKLEFLYKAYFFTEHRLEPNGIPEQEKDVWDVRKLEVVPRNGQSCRRYILDFRKIQQKGIREETKRILYSHCPEKSMGTIYSELAAVKDFAKFLSQKYRHVETMMDVNREIIEAYILYAKTERNVCASTSSGQLGILENLFYELGLETEQLELCSLFIKGDYGSKNYNMPRPYSDSEIERFNEALKQIDPQMARFILLHQMLGTRLSDTIRLKEECIYQKQGKFYIQICQAKGGHAFTKPVSQSFAALFYKALEETRKHHPQSEYVFLQKSGALYNLSYVVYHIKKMIYEQGILDDNGEYLEFRSHRFRHTLGVKLAELDMDDEEIARMLGHRNTRSVKHYRLIRNMPLAEKTKIARDELDEKIKDYRKGLTQDGKTRKDGCTGKREQQKEDGACTS